MSTFQRHHPLLSIKLFFILSVILALGTPSAFSAGNPCEVFIPTNFEKISLEKKIHVSEVIRECERELVQKPKNSSTKGVRSPQKDTRTLAYINALQTDRHTEMRTSVPRRNLGDNSQGSCPPACMVLETVWNYGAIGILLVTDI
jgi:hypothetical protein